MKLPTRKPSEALEKQYKEQGSVCFYCTAETPFINITRDHVQPKADGNTLQNNKVFACRRCNSAKGQLTIEGYRKLTIHHIVKILRAIVHKNWKATQKQIDDIRYHSKVLKTTTRVMKEGVSLLFT